MYTVHKKLKLAINPDLIDKNAARDNRLFVKGFINREATIEEIGEEVRKGRALCPQMMGPRAAKNFLASDVVTVDIDDTPSIASVLGHPLVRQYAGLVYTTASHTAEKPRVRVIFPLARTITRPDEMAAIARSLTLRLSGDPSATDAARISFGSRRAQVWTLKGCIPPDLQDELIQQSIDAATKKGSGPTGSMAARSRLTIRPDQPIRLANGDVRALDEIAPKAPAHCPYHNDKSPSAFVVESQKGVKGIHCSTCAQTYWPASSASESYDFDSFDGAVAEARDYFTRHRDLGPLFLSDTAIPGLSECSIDIVNGSPAPPALKPGILLIKSPKGSGKTQSLKRLLSGQTSVLLVGHRRALIKQSCGQLGLMCYLDDADYAVQHSWFGICLDSLARVPPMARYDVLVLDESEQLLAHFLSETHDRHEGVGRDRLFTELRHRVRQAKSVIALDADLGWVTFATLTQMASNRVPEATK
jgi:hypothetical protein